MIVLDPQVEDDDEDEANCGEGAQGICGITKAKGIRRVTDVFMSERQKEARFLKSLILCDDSTYCHELQARIKRVEKDEKCIRCALSMVSLLALLSFSGIGYSAVFVPEFARFSTHIATRIFCALGLGSLICTGVFVGFWLWYRSATNRVYGECRRFVHGLMDAKVKPGPLTSVTASKTSPSPVYEIETPKSQDEAELLQKAS